MRRKFPFRSRRRRIRWTSVGVRPGREHSSSCDAKLRLIRVDRWSSADIGGNPTEISHRIRRNILAFIPFTRSISSVCLNPPTRCRYSTRFSAIEDVIPGKSNNSSSDARLMFMAFLMSTDRSVDRWHGWKDEIDRQLCELPMDRWISSLIYLKMNTHHFVRTSLKDTNLYRRSDCFFFPRAQNWQHCMDHWLRWGETTWSSEMSMETNTTIVDISRQTSIDPVGLSFSLGHRM